jgi:hypothetical protein
MRYLRLITILMLIGSFTGCEKNHGQNAKSIDGQVIGFVMEKCYCCWGWEIKIGADTIKTENIPGLSLSENPGYPINAEITIGSKSIDCPGRQFDYYEIIEFTPVN